jgi:FdhE protein
MPSDSRESAVPVKRAEWDKRIRRAGDLAGRYSHASEILALYQPILEFQRTIFDSVQSRPRSSDVTRTPFRQQIDVDAVAQFFSRLLSLIEQKAPAKLAAEAREIRGESPESQRQILTAFLGSDASAPHSFFARVLFQPYAELLASGIAPPPPGTAGSVCPVCGGLPQAAVLHPEGDGGKRFLLCSFCLTEWEFRRILCPVCGEEDYQKLPRYTAEEINAVRVEACDTCHFYLKSVDMTLDGLAVPLVDEVATVPLDLWATEHGYKKTELNLMGF